MVIAKKWPKIVKSLISIFPHHSPTSKRQTIITLDIMPPKIKSHLSTLVQHHDSRNKKTNQQ